jgi:hypothetical protein
MPGKIRVSLGQVCRWIRRVCALCTRAIHEDGNRWIGWVGVAFPSRVNGSHHSHHGAIAA